MMLTILGDAIKVRLEGLGIFKVVEQGFSQRVLKSPPSAVFFLAEDRRVKDSPYVMRLLAWDIALLVSFIDPSKAQPQMNDLIDAVRAAFSVWIPSVAGSKPTEVEIVRFEAVEDTLLIYTVRVTMEVIPEMIT